LPQTECLFIESRDKFTLVHTIQGSSYQTHQSISQWSDSLTGWIRTHRGYLVNPDHIRSHSSKDLELACGSIVHTVPISRTYKENVEEFLRR
jgi:DNA-binding LytR/AlgR family response regulator